MCSCNGTCELKIIEFQINKITRDTFAIANFTQVRTNNEQPTTINFKKW
jgi:hypothetical protein